MSVASALIFLVADDQPAIRSLARVDPEQLGIGDIIEALGGEHGLKVSPVAHGVNNYLVTPFTADTRKEKIGAMRGPLQ